MSTERKFLYGGRKSCLLIENNARNKDTKKENIPWEGPGILLIISPCFRERPVPPESGNSWREKIQETHAPFLRLGYSEQCALGKDPGSLRALSKETLQRFAGAWVPREYSKL